MFHSLRYALSAGLLSAALVVGLAPAASASTGPWTWTDLSSQIAERQSRPVWASAFSSPYWFFTDGQDLYSGGHVWKTDGSSVSDITLDVRNAGLSRVDDIVSDGQTILFLKNVTSRNHSFEVVSYNGSYVNRTSVLRSMFDADTDVASVAGKNGVWTIVTTKGRVIRWDGSSNSISTFVTTESPFKGDIAYSVRHASPADGYLHLPVTVVPIADGAWLVTVRESNGMIRFWKYASNGTATDLTSQFASMAYLHAIASNGTTALLTGGENSTSYANRVYTYDGTTIRNVSSAAGSLPFSSWNRVRIGWNGASWMILNGKDLVRFDGSSFQNLGRTRDYFVTLSGNGNKTFLVGGAESTDGIADGPAFPLVAKLVKVVEDGGSSASNGTFGGGNTYTSAYGPTVHTTGNPADYRVGNGGTFVYRASATDGNGVDRIDLYVNGARIKTCYGDTCDFEAQYFTNGLSTRAVPFYARATDKLGYSTETAVENLTVDLNSTATAGSNTTNNSNTATSNGTTYWTWFEPNQTSIRRDQTMTYSAGAWNANGLKKIEIVVNGSVRRTCDLGLAYGNQTCTYTLYGFDYPLNTTVAVNAKITDGKDQVVWTPVQNLTVTDPNTGSNPTNGDVSVWSWLEPSSSVLNRNASATLRTQANASQGLNRVEIFVNGSLKRTCDFSRAYGTQSCDLTVYGADYAAGSQVSMNAKATEYNGKTAWSDLKTVSVQDATNGTNTGSNTNASTWVWSNPETSELKTNATVAFNVGAYDTDGLNRIEIVANGTVVQTCSFGTAYGNRECAVTLSGGSYPAGTSVFVNAKITDVNGNAVWSPSRTYTVVNANAPATPSANATQTWVWSHPDKTTLVAGEAASFNVGAWDADGLKRVELWVNGQMKQTCDYGTAYGNRECAVQIVADNYPAGTDVFVNASVIDALGNVAWSNARTYRIQSSNAATGGSTGFPIDLPGSISVTSNADGGYTPTQTIAFSVNANDQDGIDRIDILVNGSLVKTCYNTSSCSYTGGPYGDRSSVSYGAKIVDKKGFALWTGYKTILKK